MEGWVKGRGKNWGQFKFKKEDREETENCK